MFAPKARHSNDRALRRPSPYTFDQVVDFLNREDFPQRKQADKAIETVARGAVQLAEDARVLAIRRREEAQKA